MRRRWVLNRHLRGGLTKDEALRAAQRELLPGPIQSVDLSGNPVEIDLLLGGGAVVWGLAVADFSRFQPIASLEVEYRERVTAATGRPLAANRSKPTTCSTNSLTERDGRALARAGSHWRLPGPQV